MGPIAEVAARFRARSTTHAESLGPRAELEAAEPGWRADPVRFAEHYGLLADAYYMSYQATGKAEELDRALALWQTVDGVTGIDGLVATRLHNLGIQLDIARAKRDGGPEAMADRLSAHCATLREALTGYSAPTLLGDLARNAGRWGHVAAEDGAWRGAAEAYDVAARAVDALFRSVELAQRGRVLAEFRGTDAAAVSALVRAGRPKEAITTLEASRQRTTRHVRGNRDVERILSREDPELLARLQSDHAAWLAVAGVHLHVTDPGARASAQQSAREAEARFVETLKRVRRHPGLERYLMRPNFEEVRLASQARPTAYLSSSRYDTVVMLVLAEGLTIQGAIELTDAQLLTLLEDWLEVLDPATVAPDRRRHETLALLGAILERAFCPLLRDILTHPYTQKLAETAWRWGPVTLVVSGPLAYLPTHAWSPVLRDANDEITNIMPLSYAPSARQGAIARRDPKPDGSSRTLLSLSDPDPQPEGFLALPCARLEAATIAQSAERLTLLRGRDATPEAFVRLAAEHEVLHLACHAQTAPGSPLQARIELAGGAVTGSDIVGQLALDHVALVVLSACRSGQQDPYAPDEALDLGSLFLAAGARAVLANLWPIDDLAAGLFVWSVFTTWRWGTGADLPSAVSNASLWLRDLRVRDLEAFAGDYPGWRVPVRRRTRFLHPDFRRFHEPYYWSAFALSGG